MQKKCILLVGYRSFFSRLICLRELLIDNEFNFSYPQWSWYE